MATNETVKGGEALRQAVQILIVGMLHQDLGGRGNVPGLNAFVKLVQQHHLESPQQRQHGQRKTREGRQQFPFDGRFAQLMLQNGNQLPAA